MEFRKFCYITICPVYVWNITIRAESGNLFAAVGKGLIGGKGSGSTATTHHKDFLHKLR